MRVSFYSLTRPTKTAGYGNGRVRWLLPGQGTKLKCVVMRDWRVYAFERRVNAMKKFLFGFVAALILIAAGGAACVVLGLVPVATASAPLPFERLIAGTALNARVNKEAPKSSPIQASDEVYAAGGKIYRNNCAVCHGLPGQEQTAIAKGEFPKPPNLFKGKGVTDDPAGVTYWKVANGIRLTGMPGFSGSLSSEQMWQVSLLLAHADKLPATVQTTLQEPLPQNQ
jgi:thiosulfate dehydrogenase